MRSLKILELVNTLDAAFGPDIYLVNAEKITNSPIAGEHMARESTQHKLDRVRSPRVQITYDVEVGGAIELKELPFVVGVLGDFTGQPAEPLPKLKERKFVEVNPDNFDSVLEGMKPHLSFAVENKLSDDPDAPNLKVDLQFKSWTISSPRTSRAR